MIAHHYEFGPLSSPSRTLVVTSLRKDNTSWVESTLSVNAVTGVAVYVVDDPTADFRVPANKGNEAMV